MQKEPSVLAFLTLLKAGLWEEYLSLASYDKIDFNKVYQLAEEQSVVGLVAAGIEHIQDIKVKPDIALKFARGVLRLEQKNIAMNKFIAKLIEQLRCEGISALLVKGQGIAQCYNRPLWRACGDIDLLLDEINYQKAKGFLIPLADSVEDEILKRLHFGMTIYGWSVELHGTLRSGLWKDFDIVIDDTQTAVFSEEKMRSWKDGETHVFLPSFDEDIIFVFSHILQHFFKGGIGLRQICDWCRLLWTYRDNINYDLLEKRLRRMGILDEWMAFASLSINVLGMPMDAMPLYSSAHKWNRKANRILTLVLETGNFGYGRGFSYFNKYPYIIRKSISLWRHTKDGLRQLFIFPLHSTIAMRNMIRDGIWAVVKGK